MRFQIRLAAAALATACLQSALCGNVQACPFCFGSQQLTLCEQLETPDAAILVEWCSGEPGDLRRDVSPSTNFTVRKTWRGTLAAGQSVTIERYQEGAPGQQFLITGNQLDDAVRWDRAIPLSADGLKYVSQLPSSNAPLCERLRYALRHLESPDTIVANDAFDVVAASKYEELAALRKHLPTADLRLWVHDPETLVARLGVYGMLLGLAGSDEDIPQLRERIFGTHAAQPIRIGIDGVMGGFLMLSGTDGLEELDTAFLRNPNVSADDLNAVMSALRFMWEYGDEVICRDRLRQSMRLALDHEPTRELAITDLARWQDWTIIGRLVDSYRDETTDDFVKRAIIRFLLVASEAEAVNLSDEERAAVQQAAAAVGTIREADPVLYRRAERGLVRPTVR